MLTRSKRKNPDMLPIISYKALYPPLETHRKKRQKKIVQLPHPLEFDLFRICLPYLRPPEPTPDSKFWPTTSPGIDHIVKAVLLEVVRDPRNWNSVLRTCTSWNTYVRTIKVKDGTFLLFFLIVLSGLVVYT
jgi:hypothetical protein